MSKFHNEYMQMLNECLARYPRETDPIPLINQYGFSRVKSFTNWLDSKNIPNHDYFPDWFNEFLINPDYYEYAMELSYPELQKIIRTSTDPAWTSAFVRYYAKSISPKYTLFENTKDLTKTVMEVSPWWSFHNIVSEEKQDELNEEGIYDDVIQKIRVNKNTVSITVSAIEHDDEGTVVYSERASIPRYIPTVIELVRFLRDDLGSENWADENLSTYIELYVTYGWDFNLQPLDTYEDYWGDMELMWKLTRRISKRKIDQLRKDANAEVRQIIQGIMNNNRKMVQPFIDYEHDIDDALEDFEAENWGGDLEGQLAQALERARNAPAPAPLEITELPKLCQLCGDESPQAFGLYDEDDLLIGEIWACDGGCAQPLADSRNLSFGAEGDYNDFISDMESLMEKYGELQHFESQFNPSDRILSVSFDLEVEKSDFDEVVFEAENTTQKFIVGEQTPLPDADSWLIYHHPIEDLPENHVRSFMSGNPGQKVDLSHYELVAEVLGGYQPFAITQNISDSWHKNSTTIANLGNSSDGYRSTSVSDVVCDSQTGQCFLVGNFGYIALEPVDSFEAPLARHSLKRFKPNSNARKKASYWRKKGKDYIWGRNRER